MKTEGFLQKEAFRKILNNPVRIKLLQDYFFEGNFEEILVNNFPKVLNFREVEISKLNATIPYPPKTYSRHRHAKN